MDTDILFNPVEVSSTGTVYFKKNGDHSPCIIYSPCEIPALIRKLAEAVERSREFAEEEFEAERKANERCGPC